MILNLNLNNEHILNVTVSYVKFQNIIAQNSKLIIKIQIIFAWCIIIYKLYITLKKTDKFLRSELIFNRLHSKTGTTQTKTQFSQILSTAHIFKQILMFQD